MTKTLTVEGDLTAVDTLARLTTQGSVSAPSRKLPAGVKRIHTVIVAVAPDVAAVGSGAFIIRLGGTAVQGGEQVLVVAAAGGAAAQAGADPSGIAPILAVLEDLDIEVIPDVISISAEMVGSDLGSASIAVTLLMA